MRSLPVALAALLAAASALSLASLAGCGDDGDADSAAPSEGGLIDSFLLETAPPDGGDARAEGARLTFVNAAHDLGPAARLPGTGRIGTVRLCFGDVAGDVAPVRPIPEPAPANDGGDGLAGIDQGLGARLPAIDYALAERQVVPIVVLAESARNTGVIGEDGIHPVDLPCDRLLRADNPQLALREGTDYFRMAPLERGTLLPGRSHLLALTGCAASATPLNPGECGPGYLRDDDANVPNLAIHVYETSALPRPAPYGVAYLNLSTAANAYFSATSERSKIAPGLRDTMAPGGAFQPVGPTDPPLFGLGPPQMLNRLEGFFVLSQEPIGGISGASLADIAALSALTPPTYHPGATYVFVGLGTPKGGAAGGDVPVDPNRDDSPAFRFLVFPAE